MENRNTGTGTTHFSFRDLLQFVLGTEVMEPLELRVGHPAVGNEGELDVVSRLCGGLDR